MEFPSETLSSIPFCHAGANAADHVDAAMIADLEGTKKTIRIDAAEYTIHSGYLVPNYVRPETESRIRNEQLVMDRVNRFFEIAERGLNHPWTAEQIAQQKNKFITAMSLPEKQQAGRTLVGAMVQRMGRLAEAILQENTDGITIELPYDKAIFLAEFKAYYKFLVVDVEHSPILFVRLRDKSPQGDTSDHDDALFDLVREIGKPLVMPEHMVYESILRKIGYAMEAIDQTAAALQRLIQEPQIAQLLEGLHLNDPTVPAYACLLVEYTALCRARAGFKREDFDNIGPVDERTAMLKVAFETMHEALFGMVHANARYQFAAVMELVNSGLALIQDQAILRYPRNGKLATMQDIASKKKSSVEWLSDAVHAWCADQAMPPVTSHAG